MRTLARIRPTVIVVIALGCLVGLAATYPSPLPLPPEGRGDDRRAPISRDGSGNGARVLLASEASGNSARVDDRPAKRQGPKPELVVLRGKVVELGAHLMEKFQVPVDEDLGRAAVVLVTDEGEVHPLVKDIRSRGFFMDKRIRGRPMELHVHRYPGLPFVRLIDVYSFKDGKKHKLDYWCTVCAISTFQPGPCPCCQDEIELRERLVEER